MKYTYTPKDPTDPTERYKIWDFVGYPKFRLDARQLIDASGEDRGTRWNSKTILWEDENFSGRGIEDQWVEETQPSRIIIMRPAQRRDEPEIISVAEAIWGMERILEDPERFNAIINTVFFRTMLLVKSIPTELCIQLVSLRPRSRFYQTQWRIYKGMYGKNDVRGRHWNDCHCLTREKYL